jgi:quercetin dioxygenase-like cupin family protein
LAHTIVTPGFVRVDARGEFVEVLNTGEWGSVIIGRMAPDAVLGNHYHKRVRIYFFLTKGTAEVRTTHVMTGARDAFTLNERQGVFLEPGESHAIRFLSYGEFLMLKSERYDAADPDTYPFPVTP